MIDHFKWYYETCFTFPNLNSPKLPHPIFFPTLKGESKNMTKSIYHLPYDNLQLYGY